MYSLPVMPNGTSRVTTDSNQRPAQSATSKPKLLDQVRQAIRAGHYSKRTEKTYVEWAHDQKLAFDPVSQRPPPATRSH